MESLDRIKVEDRAGVRWITLNRPGVMNAVDTATLRQLEAALVEAETEPRVRVLVLTGAGIAFSTGGDRKERIGREQNPAWQQEYLALYRKVIGDLERLSKPVIAAINGLAIAGGLELAMGCDIIIASDRARLGDHHANIGGIPRGGATQRLPRLIGLPRAMFLLLTGAWLSAREAERIGLVAKVVPEGQLEAVVEEVAQNLVEKSPSALKWIKRAVRQGLQGDLETGLDLEAAAIRAQQAERLAGGESEETGKLSFREEGEHLWVGRER